ncbi:MAG: hypothetical protein MI864_19020 [Pseudomonadales bacterium]|nr:hypothetical protein [Pseudomonadales bacterium]
MNLAIIRFSALGDIAAAMPTWNTLPWKPVVITSPLGKALLEDEYDQFLVLENKKLATVYQLIKTIRKQRFELILDYQGNDRSKAITFLSGVRHFNAKGADISNGAAYIHHQVTQKLAPQLKLDLNFTPKPRDYIVFNTGSSAKWASKRLPAHKWEAFAIEAYERYGLPIKFTGAHDEVDYVNELTRNIKVPHSNVAGKTSLTELKSLLRNSFLTVSTDSAAMHLSAAMKTPTIGIFGATNWIIANPFGPWSTVLHDPELQCPSASQLTVDPNIYERIDLSQGLETLAPYLQE